ncbi:TadE/TadG family type IV pilus assembly protein [Aeoliella sp. SH292]|uniref:TadE/TadG family type IV pilus assembly protein n=1 Tax=Aeoliella sp. SH292 TaxID=3454464 RepID=UPI003F9699A3
MLAFAHGFGGGDSAEPSSMHAARLRPFSNARRRGTTVVETAFVLPVFLIFVLSLIEFGHALMIKNMLRSATRSGARLGATDGNSSSAVEALVKQKLGAVMDPELASVSVKNAQVYDGGGTTPTDGQAIEALPAMEVADADPRQLFLVRARIAYNDVALVPMPFMQDVVLEGQAFIRHE